MGIDRDSWNELASIPGTIPKPPKRERKKKEPKPRTRIKQRNEKRAKAAREEAFGIQAQACRDIGICACCGGTGRTVPHHHTSRGAGGTDADTLPLLQDPCHLRLHAVGTVTFWRQAGRDPDVLVEAMREWVAAGCPENNSPVRRG